MMIRRGSLATAVLLTVLATPILGQEESSNGETDEAEDKDGQSADGDEDNADGTSNGEEDEATDEYPARFE